jgi:hypothetical protein
MDVYTVMYQIGKEAPARHIFKDIDAADSQFKETANALLASQQAGFVLFTSALGGLIGQVIIL